MSQGTPVFDFWGQVGVAGSGGGLYFLRHGQAAMHRQGIDLSQLATGHVEGEMPTIIDGPG